jgi:protein tyrosine/serine phosphatase
MSRARFLAHYDQLPAIMNLRDVGGCVTSDGRVVSRGLLYRSAEFDCTQGSTACAMLGQLGVRRVIDLRAESEASKSADLTGVERVHAPFLVSVENRDAQPIDRSPPATGVRYYEYLLEGRAAVLGVMRRLVDARSQPTLIHCVSGRDRTGMVIACVLSVLGVADVVIAADYALSSVMDDEEGRCAHPDNVLHLLRIVRERHGSVEGMITEGDIGQLPIEDLRVALLEAE